MDGPRSDPRLDRDERQPQADQSGDDEKAEDSGNGDEATAAEGSDELVTFLESDEFRDGRIGNWAVIRNPDGTEAVRSYDVEGQQAEAEREAAAEGPDLTRLSPDDQARMTPGLNPIDIGDMFAAAAEGDTVSQALVSTLTEDASLMGMERQAQLGVVDPALLHAAVRDRIEQAQADAGRAAGGDRDAWVRLQQNLAGVTPTNEQLAAFDRGGGPSVPGLERQFQLLGAGTRPQEYLERVAGLTNDLDAARGGDPGAVSRLATAFGMDPADLTKDIGLGGPTLDGMASMLSGILQHPAGAMSILPGATDSHDSPAPSSDPSSMGSSPAASGGLGPTGVDPSGVTPTGRGGGDGSGGSSASGVGGGGVSSAGGTDGGSPVPDNVDPDDGSGMQDAGGDDGGDPSSGQTNDQPPAGGAGGSGASGSSGSGSSGNTGTSPTEVDFSGEGTVFIAGGGDAEQRADGTARVENPDGSVDYVSPSGENIHHRPAQGGSGSGSGGGGGGGSGSSGSSGSGASGSGSSGSGGESGSSGSSGSGSDTSGDGGDSGSSGSSGSDSSGDGAGASGSGADSGGASGGGSGSDDDESGYVVNDPGGYTNTALSGEQAAANVEQRLVREGGDRVDPGTEEPLVVMDIPDSSTQEYWTGDVEGAAPLTRMAPPVDPVGPPGTEEPIVFTGENPNDPGVYEAGGTAGAAAVSAATAQPQAAAEPIPVAAATAQAPGAGAVELASPLAANLDTPAALGDQAALSEPMAAPGQDAPGMGGGPGDGEGMGAPDDLSG